MFEAINDIAAAIDEGFQELQARGSEAVIYNGVPIPGALVTRERYVIDQHRGETVIKAWRVGISKRDLAGVKYNDLVQIGTEIRKVFEIMEYPVSFTVWAR